MARQNTLIISTYYVYIYIDSAHINTEQKPTLEPSRLPIGSTRNGKQDDVNWSQDSKRSERKNDPSRECHDTSSKHRSPADEPIRSSRRVSLIK